MLSCSIAKSCTISFCSVEMGKGHRAENGTPAFHFQKDSLDIFHRQ